MHAVVFPCIHEHHPAPTAILQPETQGIPGIANYRAVLCYLSHPSYTPLSQPPPALQETIHTALLPRTGAVWHPLPLWHSRGWKRGWKWMSTSYGSPSFCPLNWRSSAALCMGGLGIFGECVKEGLGLDSASVPRQQKRGRHVPSLND